MTTFPLRTLRLRPGQELRDEVTIALEPYELGGERYLPVPADVVAALEIQRASSGYVFQLRFDTRLHGPCVRCLRDAVVDVPVAAIEYQAADDAAPEELRTEYVADDLLQLSAWARDAIATALPEQIVCRRDCAGLCPVCGVDLNDTPHVHEDTVPDPRWAALESLRTDA